MSDHDDEANLWPAFPRRVRFLGEWLLVAGLGVAVRCLPFSWARGLGAAVGAVASWVLPDRKVALANLHVVLGDSVSEAEKRRLAVQTFRRLGRVVLGLFWSPRLSSQRIAQLCDVTALAEVLRELQSQKRGVVLVTAHYGDWELLCHATAAAGYPFMMVTEPVANPRLQAVFDRLRGCTGNRPIPPKYALLKLFRGLRRGDRVAVMCDVNGRRGRGGVWVDFFGLPVFNGVAMAELALRTKSVVVFAAAMPQAGGRHVVRCWPSIDPIATSDHDADVRNLTQQIADYHADLLQLDPAPWLWTYKRWKRKPAVDTPGYPFYASFKRVK